MNDQESTVTKILPLFLILLTSTIAIVIIAISDQRSTGILYGFVTSNGDTIGLVIQVVSAALGACQVFAITALINLSARLRMQTGRAAEFRRLKFIAAITSGSSQAIRSSLPAPSLAVVIIVVLMLKVPAALWAGALTPVLADVVKDEGRIPIPAYPETSLSAWQGSFRREEDGTVDMSPDCNWTVTGDEMIAGAAAMVSTCPALDLVSALLGSLATAAAGTPNVPMPHSRIDSSGWTNLGRSFGVGSSPGIVPVQNLSAREAPILSFDYFENGYRAMASCARNESSNYTISNTAEDLGATSHVVAGTLPNSIPGRIEEYALSSSTDENNFLAWSALSNNGENILAVAGTGLYAPFDKLQCNIRFDIARFAVNVNVSNSIIAAKPVPNDHAVEDMEPTGQFATSVFYALEQVSRMSGNTVVSSLGTPLEHNIRIIKARDPSLTDEESVILSLEYGLGTLLDNLLVANAQSQLYILEHSTTVPLSIRYRAVKIGSDKYIISVLATNCVVLVAIVCEVLRTRLWKGLTAFDFTDIQSIAIAASAGGHAIAARCQTDDRGRDSSGRLSVSLRTRGGQWALVPAADTILVDGPVAGKDTRSIRMRPARWNTKPGFERVPSGDECRCEDETGHLAR